MPLEPLINGIVKLGRLVPEPDPNTPWSVRRGAADRQFHRFGRLVMGTGPRVDSITHRTVPVDGGEIVVRVYSPLKSGILPLHVFLHGGGWCEGTLDERDDRCRALAADVECIVASVEYRLAPENQYPRPPEDCYAALCWLVAHADELEIDPNRVSIGGESAGGNLAAVVALMTRDRSGPALVFQLLDVPATDLTLQQPSIDRLATDWLLTKESMERFVEAYLPDPALVTDPHVSPLHAPDLSGLPPARVMTTEFDPLQDDGAAYAERLQAAGVPTEHVRLAGHFHVSFAFTRISKSARDNHLACVTALRKAYGTSPTENN